EKKIKAIKEIRKLPEFEPLIIGYKRAANIIKQAQQKNLKVKSEELIVDKLIEKEEKELYRANYTFRAVYLNPGPHKVIFEYKSIHFTIGLIITITTVCALLGFYIPFGLWRLAVKVRQGSIKSKIKDYEKE
ncbi:MAG: hypothetical protein ABIL15_02455, partial [candidate division WOR-3 bacterium]